MGLFDRVPVSFSLWKFSSPSSLTPCFPVSPSPALLGVGEGLQELEAPKNYLDDTEDAHSREEADEAACTKMKCYEVFFFHLEIIY